MGLRGSAGFSSYAVGEVGGTHEAVLTNAFLIGEVMEHQDPLAQAVGAYFESGTVR